MKEAYLVNFSHLISLFTKGLNKLIVFLSVESRYRPAFAPSADLPSSEDENDEDLDRVIQHNLPTTRPLKPRSSLKQKLGSVLARVGTRKSTSPPPIPGSRSAAESGLAVQDYPDTEKVQQETKLTGTTGNISRRTNASPRRAGFEGKVSHDLTQLATKEEFTSNENSPTTPTGHIGRFGEESEIEKENENQYRDSAGGTYSGGLTVLARKLSRRATTGGPSARGRLPRERREIQPGDVFDRKAAEELLRSTYTSGVTYV